MKKFGTPISAGPGSESENVGVEADGTPGPAIPLPEVGLRIAGLRAAGLVGVGALALRWLEGFSARAWPGAAVEDELVVVDELELELERDVDREGEREVELEVVVEDAEEDELDEGEGEDEEDVVVVALLEEVVGAHDSLSEATTPVIGSDICEIGVPGATLTLNV